MSNVHIDVVPAGKNKYRVIAGNEEKIRGKVIITWDEHVKLMKKCDCVKKKPWFTVNGYGEI